MAQVVFNKRRSNNAAGGSSTDGAPVVADKTPAPAKSDFSKHGFKFKARSSTGNRADYFVPIEERAAAELALQRAGMEVERIIPRSGARRKRARIPKPVELAAIAQQLGDQWEAGIPPARILESLGTSSPNQLVMAALVNAAAEVRNGATVSEAIRSQTTVTAMPDLEKRAAAIAAGKTGRPIFPATFAHAIRIAENAGAVVDPLTGEKRGAMQMVMERFADDQIRTDALVSAIRGAMIYPAAVFVVVIVVVVIMLYFAVPRLKEMYESMTNGGQLPWPTQILISTSDFLTSPLGMAGSLLVMGAAVGFILWGWRTEKGQDFVGRHSLWLPLFGEMIREQNMANLVRILGMMASGSGGLNYALRETANAMSNPVYRTMLLDVLFEFEREARPLEVLFRPYTPLVTDSWHTILVSYEKSGGLDKLCARFAGVLERRNERRVEIIKHALSTYLIIPIAVGVAAVVVALYMPLFDLVGKMANTH